MSRGDVRSALRRRLEEIIKNLKLTNPADPAQLMPLTVVEQDVKAENSGVESNNPGLVAALGKSTQRGGKRTVGATVYCLVPVLSADDTEQVYRDPENIIELIEINLISNPWLDKGTYELIEPWESDVTGGYPLAGAWLSFNVDMPVINQLLGPDGSAIEEAI